MHKIDERPEHLTLTHGSGEVRLAQAKAAMEKLLDATWAADALAAGRLQ